MVACVCVTAANQRLVARVLVESIHLPITLVLPCVAARYTDLRLATSVMETTLGTVYRFVFVLRTSPVVTTQSMRTLLGVMAFVTFRSSAQAFVIAVVGVYTLALVAEQTVTTLFRLAARHARRSRSGTACEIVHAVPGTLVHHTVTGRTRLGVLARRAQRACSWTVVVVTLTLGTKSMNA